MINYNGTISKNLPTLSINNRAFKYGDGLFETIKVTNNKVVYLKDVAEVEDGYEELSSISRLNNNPVVSLSLSKKAGENLLAATDQIYKIIDSTKKFFSKNKEKEDLQTLSFENVTDFISFQYGAQLLTKNLTITSHGHEVEFIAFKSTFLNTVIGSLISNSIRYSKDGGVINVFAREVNKKVEIVIEDQAGGFPEDVLENLKSNFKSKPTPSTSGDVGSGMGLVLAKSYLEIMNGSLEIEGNEKGSQIILKMSK